MWCKKQSSFLDDKHNIISRIISKLDRSKFNKLSLAKGTDKHNKGYNSWTHLVSMLFCQFVNSQSVRDISNGLRSATGNLNHIIVLEYKTEPLSPLIHDQYYHRTP
ncbi:DUF4372 domain-containing protein [Arcticibacter eurypsychrophilus]|uniref:DUF4372 domain-containing protein n=1 Tax=Arcticibacter eurypsychrophilus TaxID=1434752 RepID=UPI00373FE091